MFDQIKLPVCPVCGAKCLHCNVNCPEVGSRVQAVFRFACGAQHTQTTEDGGRCKYNYDSRDADEIVLDAARQRHAEVRADAAERLKAAQDEQGKGYGTSV